MTNDTTTTGSVAPEQWPTGVLDAARQIRGDQPTPTLADRARAAWAAQQETDRRDDAEREPNRVSRVSSNACRHTKQVLGVVTDPHFWTVRPPASPREYAPNTADITLDGLRLTYESVGDGTLLLTWRCPMSGCGANRQTALTSLASLGHALATVDEPDLAPGSPWFCWHCQYRRREAAQADATPEPSFAEQLEQLARAIVRDEIRDSEVPF